MQDSDTGQTSYDRDFVSWTAGQAALLRAGQFHDLDAERLAEEIGDLGSNVRHALFSHLAVLLQHLLKWKYQARLQGRSWQLTIVAQRAQIAKLLLRNPSLRSIAGEALSEAYEDGVRLAEVETGLPRQSFPAACEWSFEQVLDDSFWPGLDAPVS